MDFREAMARKLLTHAEGLNFEDAGAVRGFVVSHRLPPVAPPSKRLLKDWPKDLPTLDTKTVAHILYGYRQGKGHLHGYGWVSGGDEFPGSMEPKDIVDALAEVLNNILPQKGKRGDNIYLQMTLSGNRKAVVSPKNRVTTYYPCREQ